MISKFEISLRELYCAEHATEGKATTSSEVVNEPVPRCFSTFGIPSPFPHLASIPYKGLTAYNFNAMSKHHRNNSVVRKY